MPAATDIARAPAITEPVVTAPAVDAPARAGRLLRIAVIVLLGLPLAAFALPVVLLALLMTGPIVAVGGLLAGYLLVALLATGAAG